MCQNLSFNVLILTILSLQYATDVAQTELSPTHPLRLGLALNISIFHYEILGSPDRASILAQQALDDAVGELDSLSDDGTQVMLLLRGFLWDTHVNIADELVVGILTLCTSKRAERDEEA
jgi:hypothetical protein